MLGFEPEKTLCLITRRLVSEDLGVAALESAAAKWMGTRGLYSGGPPSLDGKTLCGIHGEAIPRVHPLAPRLQGPTVLEQVAALGNDQQSAGAKKMLVQVSLGCRG